MPVPPPAGMPAPPIASAEADPTRLIRSWAARRSSPHDAVPRARLRAAARAALLGGGAGRADAPHPELADVPAGPLRAGAELRAEPDRRAAGRGAGAAHRLRADRAALR